MRLLVWLLALAALAVGISIAAGYNQGYALFVLPPWRLELSLNLLIVLALAGFLGLHLLLRLLSAMLGLPASVAAYRARRRQLAAESAMQEGIRFMLEGRFGHALRRAEAAYDAGHAPGVTALLAWRAAHSMGDGRRADHWRVEAQRHDGTSRSARLMTEADLALNDRDFARAAAALATLERESGRHIAAQRLALKAHHGLGHWREVLHLLRRLEKHGAMTPLQAGVWKLKAHREAIRGLTDDREGLVAYLGQIPAAELKDPQLVSVLARALMQAGDCNQSAGLIESVLDDREWDSALAGLYGGCGNGDILGHISHAEKWLTDHPRDHQLLLTLGRLCRRQKLWGKAQSYLEASLSVQPSRETHIELAGLLDFLEQGAAANRHYRAAALL
ncbi:MAG: heme biosynthesis protein HemY [Proteobacteria bacterium]|nr:heme biosynthesis protein HemY [Pseudomonadota bacterium]HQR04302.1 heme biosynthesis HemY N-terminal domain-containing protein [Rhodocyclaceae bacterium]